MKNDLFNDLNKSLNLGRESFETTPELEDIEAVDFIPEGETATAQDIESVEQGDEIEELVEDSEEEMGDAEAVEDLAVAVEAAVAANKGLNPIEAAALTMAYHRATCKHYKDPMSMLPAREAHQSSNMTDLVLVHESLKETASNLYNKSIAAIKDIIKKLVEFVQGLVNKYGALERRFGNIHKTAREMTGEPEGQVPARTGSFSINGKVETGTVMGIVDTLRTVERNGSFSESIIDLNGKEMTTDESSFKDLIQRLSTKSRNDVDTAGDMRKNDGRAPENVVEYSAMPGDNYMGTVKLSETGLLGLKFGKLAVGKDDAEEVVAEGEKHGARMSMVAVPSKSQILEKAKDAHGFLRIIKTNSSAKARKFQSSALFKDAYNAAGGDEQHDTGDRENMKLMTRFVGVQATFIRDFNVYSFEAVTALADFLEKAVKSSSIEGSATDAEPEKTA